MPEKWLQRENIKYWENTNSLQKRTRQRQFK